MFRLNCDFDSFQFCTKSHFLHPVSNSISTSNCNIGRHKLPVISFNEIKLIFTFLLLWCTCSLSLQGWYTHRHNLARNQFIFTYSSFFIEKWKFHKDHLWYIRVFDFVYYTPSFFECELLELCYGTQVLLPLPQLTLLTDCRACSHLVRQLLPLWVWLAQALFL